MAIPKTTKAWVVQGTTGFDDLVFKPDHPLPALTDHDVLVKFHGASLNFRDLVIAQVDISPPDSPNPPKTDRITGQIPIPAI